MKSALLVLMGFVMVANAQTVNKTTNDVKIRQTMAAGGGNRMLEYKLDQVETVKTVLTNKDKAKASSDGEDVISPLVQKAAGDVLANATQKQ